MPAVHRAGSLRFVVFLDDHGPPHVPVFSGRAEAKSLLGSDDDGPELDWARGFDRAGLRRVLVEVMAGCGTAGSRSRRMRKVEVADGRSKAERDREIDRALARGRRRAVTEPQAERAHYERRTGRVVVDLTNGCSFVFPARSLQGLAQATDAELAGIEILGAGHGLHWPALDADFTVPGLLMGVFGTRAWMMSELARRAGQTTSKAKAAAARANGRKGGRPRRVA